MDGVVEDEEVAAGAGRAGGEATDDGRGAAILRARTGGFVSCAGESGEQGEGGCGEGVGDEEGGAVIGAEGGDVGDRVEIFRGVVASGGDGGGEEGGDGDARSVSGEKGDGGDALHFG